MEYLLDSGIVMGDNMNFPPNLHGSLKGREYLLHWDSKMKHTQRIQVICQIHNAAQVQVCALDYYIELFIQRDFVSRQCAFTFLQLPSSFLFF